MSVEAVNSDSKNGVNSKQADAKKAFDDLFGNFNLDDMFGGKKK